MRRSAARLAGRLAPLALALSACGSDDGGAPAAPPEDVAEFDGDCSKVTAPTFAELEAGVLTRCVSCHSSAKTGDARNGAPAAFNFDTYAAAKAGALYAVAEVKQRKMPYPDGDVLTNVERNQLYEWALCGMPE